MPVSGNKEPGVLSRQSSSVSAGIPLKKRRFLLVQPPSPPREEILPAAPEENDVKLKEDSSSNIISKEESSIGLKDKEQSLSDLNRKEEYSSDAKNKDGSSEFKSKGASESDLSNKAESGADLKNKEDSSSDHGYVNVNSSVSMPDTGKNSLLEVKKEISSDPRVNFGHPNVDISGSKFPQPGEIVGMGSGNKPEGRTQLLLNEKYVSSKLPGTSTSALAVGLKKEINNEDCKLKLSTSSANNELSLGPRIEPLAPGLGIQDTQGNSALHDKLDASILSLSLTKGNPVVEEKHKDAISGSDSADYACTNRSKWDLNTTMDVWEGSAGDLASEGTTDSSIKKTGTDVTKPSLRSIIPGSVCSSKGKQVIAADEQRPILSTSSVQHNHQSEDTTLCLTLSTFNLVSSTPVVSGTDVSNSGMQNSLKSAVNINSLGCGVVKAEPPDENSKNRAVGATSSHMRLLDFSSVKREPVEQNNPEAVRVSTNTSQKLIERKSVKSEQAIELSQELCKTGDVISQHPVANAFHCQESISSSSSSILPMPLTPQKFSPSRLVTSSDLSSSVDISNQSEYSVHTKEFHKGKDALLHGDATANMIYEPLPMDRGANVPDKLGTCVVEIRNLDNQETCGSKRMNENSHDLHVDREGSLGDEDEEKINISAEMMDEDSYGSDCESDGNQASNRLDRQGRNVKDDDDYEDGEVREPTMNSTVGEPIPERLDTESVKPDDHDTRDSSTREFPVGSEADQFLLSNKEGEPEVCDDKTIECVEECVGKASNENDEQLTDKDATPQKLLPDGKVADEKLLSHPSERQPLDRSAKKSVSEDNKKDIPSDGTTSGHRAVTTIESSFNGNDAAKDSMSGSSRSRIINLPRASVTSPSRTRSIADRPLPTRSGRDRYSDIEEGKFLLHRNRDQVETVGPQKFFREKIYDQPYRNSRPYGRGRGRFSGRLDTSRSEWNAEREFALGSYKNDDYRFSRNKSASDMADADFETNEFITTTTDGSDLSSGRGRRLNDDLHSFRNLSSRRLSPGGRDGPPTRDIRMLRRIPRNISPGRRNDENGSDFVGLQHDQKLARSLPDEIMDPPYTRPQPIYDSGTGQFVRGNRNFSTVQRRGFPRVRSKSPVGSRGRSPGPWSPPRRRSPDGFGALPQLTQHRSAALYGMERIRSPDRSCFPEEMVTRRRGSPSFMVRPSNDMRDVESGREHGNPRPMNSSRRSPSDRVFGRSSRRLDVSDPRIGTGEDEYFVRPVHSNRFHEFHGDGGSDERRKCSERRGLIRPFRPTYMGDGENLRFHLDDGPRPFRFCAEGDAEFGGRGMREREFDGRIKNRAMAPPRRIRNIEGQEGNYRHSGQVWHDDGFNEAPGFKRRRF